MSPRTTCDFSARTHSPKWGVSQSGSILSTQSQLPSRHSPIFSSNEPIKPDPPARRLSRARVSPGPVKLATMAAAQKHATISPAAWQSSLIY